MHKFRKLIAAAVIAMAGLGATVAQANTIVVGGKDFTEQLIMASMTAQLLKAHGFNVAKKDGMGSNILRQAQLNGQVDVYWEYTGTSLINYNHINKKLSPEQTYETVKKLDAKKGLVWLDPSKANNTYALAMRETEANKLNIHTISQLAKAVNAHKHLVFATDAEFYARPDGLRPLEKVYGFRFSLRDIKRMDPGLTYQAVKDHQADIALVFATDGRIPAFHFVILKDDKDFFPNYALTPVVRADTLKKNPRLKPLLDSLSGKLDDKTMARLNADVDVKHETIEKVAHNFLAAHSLL